MDKLEGITFLPATHLYNMLQQGLQYPNLSDSNFLLMLDARSKSDYNESHIVTAKKAPMVDEGDVFLPFDAEVECKVNIVVYDSNTSVDKNVEGPAIKCAQALWQMGSRNKVKVLEGGYEVFSALYPFLRTQKIIFMPREQDEIKTYPIEILHGSLYLGNRRQANALYIQKDLKVKAHVNCCMEAGEILSASNVIHIPVEDDNRSDLLSQFTDAVKFIDVNIGMGHPVLVYSDLGISRGAAVVMAYLIFSSAMTLESAYKHVLGCCGAVRPNRGFIQQLSQWEKLVRGEILTDISDPNY